MTFDTWTDEALRALADAGNREILRVVEETEEPVALEDLAERLVAREIPLARSSAVEDERARTCIRLHHHRLPQLDAAGLVEYHPDEQVVLGSRAADPVEEWRDGAWLADLLSRFGDEPQAERGADVDAEGDAEADAADHARPSAKGQDSRTSEEAVGILENRAAIAEYGIDLADAAETELFAMYLDMELLEGACLAAGRRAVDRGVSVTLGSADPAVREVVRNELPEAVIWEPQRDWQHAGTYPRIGRLALADRRSVMLSILESPPTPETAPGERALVGAGPANPLVVLVRDLLGARIDDLDSQAGTVRNRIG